MTIFQQKVQEWNQGRREFITEIMSSEDREGIEKAIARRFPNLPTHVIEKGMREYERSPGYYMANYVHSIMTQYKQIYS